MFVTVPRAELALTTVADGSFPRCCVGRSPGELPGFHTFFFSFILFGLFGTFGSRGKAFIAQSTDVRKYLLQERMAGRGGSRLVQMLSGCRQAHPVRPENPIAIHPTTLPDIIPCDLVDLQQRHTGDRGGAQAQGRRTYRESVSSQPEQVA